MYGNEAMTVEGPGMYGNMMKYVAGQQRDGAVDRPEFDPDHTTSGWPAVPDDDARKRVESYIIKYIPDAHKYSDGKGVLRVVYLDERGRAYDCALEEVPDSELVRMAKRYGMRFAGHEDPNKPQTSRTDHGYSKPATEENVMNTADQLREAAELDERAPKMARGKWDVEGKTVADENAAIKAAVAASRRGGGKAIKIWEKADPVKGVRGTMGLSVVVKPITRKGSLAGL